MKRIYKYPLLSPITGLLQSVSVSMPAFAKICNVGIDMSGNYCIWAIIDDNEPAVVNHDFEIVGTGHPIPEGTDYIGTISDNGYQWHVFKYS